MAQIEWKTEPIRNLYEGLYDGPHATPKPADSGPIFLGIKNVTDDGQLDLSDIRNIAEEDYAAWTKRVEPRAGDLVFTYEATLNRYAIIPEGFRGCLGRRMALIRPNLEKLDVRFLLYYFFTDAWRAVIKKNTLTGATVDRIPLTTFPDFPVTIPPLPVQREIAAVLTAYDELIENNQRRIRILEEMARSLYREWFVHFRFPGHDKVKSVESEMGMIPIRWVPSTLETLTSVITKGTTPTTLGKNFTTEGINFVKVESINEAGNLLVGKLAKIDADTHKLLKRSQLMRDDILFSIAGAIGRVTLVPGRWVDAPAVGGQVYSTLGEHWLKKGRKCRSTVIDWTGYLSDPYGVGHDFVAYGKNYNGYLYIDV